MQPVKPSFFETVFVLWPLAVSGLIGMICLAALPLCVALDVYTMIQSQGRDGLGIAAGLLLYALIWGVPFCLINLVRGIAWAVIKLNKIIVGD
jgi:hypothetical protein